MKNKSRIEDRFITSDKSLLTALKQMDTQKVKTLFLSDDNHFPGLLTL